MDRIGSQWRKGNHSRVHHRRMRRDMMTRNKMRVLGMEGKKSEILRLLIYTVAKTRTNRLVFRRWEVRKRKKETEISKFLSWV